MPAAILFDLDGTLIDTVSLYERAVIESLRTVTQIDMSPDRFHELYGTGTSIGEWIVQCGGDRSCEHAVRATRDRLYTDMLHSDAVWLPGAESMLRKLMHPRAIVTGSWKSFVDSLHTSIQLDAHVQTVITADDMGDRSKPHPYGLLLAAERLAVNPQECVYVGDQWFDMQAARAAGMRSVLAPNKHTTNDAFALADEVIDHLEEIVTLVASA